MGETFPEENIVYDDEPVNLEAVDTEGKLDHGNLEPTEQEAEQGRMLGNELKDENEVDPDDEDDDDRDEF